MTHRYNPVTVLEHISGCDLFELSNEIGSMNETVVRHILSQVIEIVQKLAENRIAHRDIKDENIMVDINTYKGTQFNIPICPT